MQPSTPPPFKKRAKRYVRYLLLRALFFVLGALPLRVAIALGEAFGSLGFRLNSKERGKALASLEIAFPEKSEAERLEIARQSFRHLGACGGELCCVRRIDRMIEQYVELPEADLAVLRAALAEGRGIVYTTGHVGNFELMARRIGAIGHPCGTVAKPPSDPWMTAFIDKLRASARVKTIWRGRGTAVPEIHRALAANEMVGFVIDQDTRVRGVFVDFFGRKAHTPRSPAEFALETGAAVVAGTIFRKPGGGHRVEIERIPVPRTGDAQADTLELTQRMTSAIERAIRRAPETWAWIHQRWKTRPPEEVAPTPSATGQTKAA